MRVFLSILLITLASSIIAQQGIEVSRLSETLEDVKITSKERQKRVNSFLKKKNSKAFSNLLNKKEVMLYDVIDGHPLFIGTYNDDAAEAIGATALYGGEDTDLGIVLTGDGEEVGIWDGGIIRTTHQELQGRIRYADGSASTEFSDHSTSVAGTLLGSGVEDRARGMAFDATCTAYDFNNDEEEMLTAQMQRQLILSNHSYGPLTGWNDGQWLGDTRISDREDYRFGYYDGQARIWDRIAYDAPFYLIVKSAGNDRGDTGSGFPADGPFDCIAGSGLSKNIMTIGAIQKSQQGYDDPRNIRMSSFSGWGPTDDGRIKPDICAVGVSIYSPDADADDSYNVTQGTSFSSPSAAGGLLLLQQLHNNQYNTYMKSATLKALAIQTAKECGGNDGPDYQFGWGLLDVEKASRHLLNLDGENKQLIETELAQGEEYMIELTPTAGSNLTATLVWTDLPGTPVGASLDPTDLMLINDLDMRIVDETGNEFMPWILDPANPNFKAEKGDNFRDNVEKIEATGLEPRKYFLKVTHKGELEGDLQEFSIILDYESENSPLTELYWINNNGSWISGSNWSETSGGAEANAIPTVENKVIFDDNSSSSDVITTTLTSDLTVGSLFSFSSKPLEIDLNGNTLTITNGIVMGGNPFTIKNGIVELLNIESQDLTLNLNGGSFEDCQIVLPAINTGSWSIDNSSISVDDLTLQGGGLSISNSRVEVSSLRIENGDLSVFGSIFTGLETLAVSEDASYTDDASTSYTWGSTSAMLSLNQVTSLGTFSLSEAIGQSDINLSSIGGLELSNTQMLIQGDFSTNSLRVLDGSIVEFDQSIIQVRSDFELESGISLVSGNVGTVDLIERKKYCFSNLNVTNVSLIGNGAVNADEMSTLSNATGWVQGVCENLLFSAFDVTYLCEGGLSELINNSTGQIENTVWLVNGDQVSTNFNAFHSFEEAGLNEVTLSISDGMGNESEWTEAVIIEETILDSNYIIQNSTSLVSFRNGDSYQWYRNGDPIEGANMRTLPYDGDQAMFFVVVFSGECNRRSTILDLSTSVIEVEGGISEEGGFSIYPNPVTDQLYINAIGNDPSNIQIQVIDLLGRSYSQIKVASFNDQIRIPVSSLEAGVYHLLIQNDKGVFSSRFVKQ